MAVETKARGEEMTQDQKKIEEKPSSTVFEVIRKALLVGVGLACPDARRGRKSRESPGGKGEVAERTGVSSSTISSSAARRNPARQPRRGEHD